MQTQKKSISNKSLNQFPANHQINSEKIVLIDAEGKNQGTISLVDGLKLAKQVNLDLVQIASSKNLPTCKILDLGKFKFQQQKKQRELDRKQREAQIEEREIQFTVNTGLNDLKVKAKKALELLEDGARVKIMVKFKGREMAHPEVGQETLRNFLTCLPEELAIDATAPTFNNRDLILHLKKKI